MVHSGEHVIMGQSLPAHSHHRHRRLVRVEHTLLIIALAPGVPAGVGVLLLCHHPEQGGVGVGQRGHGPHAAPSAATSQWVGCATIHIKVITTRFIQPHSFKDKKVQHLTL